MSVEPGAAYFWSCKLLVELSQFERILLFGLNEKEPFRQYSAYEPRARGPVNGPLRRLVGVEAGAVGGVVCKFQASVAFPPCSVVSIRGPIDGAIELRELPLQEQDEGSVVSRHLVGGAVFIRAYRVPGAITVDMPLESPRFFTTMSHNKVILVSDVFQSLTLINARDEGSDVRLDVQSSIVEVDEGAFVRIVGSSRDQDQVLSTTFEFNKTTHFSYDAVIMLTITGRAPGIIKLSGSDQNFVEAHTTDPNESVTADRGPDESPSTHPELSRAKDHNTTPGFIGGRPTRRIRAAPYQEQLSTIDESVVSPSPHPGTFRGTPDTWQLREGSESPATRSHSDANHHMDTGLGLHIEAPSATAPQMTPRQLFMQQPLTPPWSTSSPGRSTQPGVAFLPANQLIIALTTFNRVTLIISKNDGSEEEQDATAPSTYVCGAIVQVIGSDDFHGMHITYQLSRVVSFSPGSIVVLTGPHGDAIIFSSTDKTEVDAYELDVQRRIAQPSPIAQPLQTVVMQPGVVRPGPSQIVIAPPMTPHSTTPRRAQPSISNTDVSPAVRVEAMPSLAPSIVQPSPVSTRRGTPITSRRPPLPEDQSTIPPAPRST